MKKIHLYIVLLSLVFLFSLSIQAQVDPKDEFQDLNTNRAGKGIELEIEFHKGIQHYYPLMAIWVEDTSGNYIQSLYVAESIAKGVFEHGKVEKGKWVEGEKSIPAALPYWGHQRGLQGDDTLFLPTKQNPLPDAYTGATPTSSFLLHTRTDKDIGAQFRVFFEINQSWDWNEYWFNGKYPGNTEYMKSAQPALVYATTIDLTKNKREYLMKPIGHSHPYGATGKLYKELSTLTTALEIADKIVVRVK